jgi:hypothetical protein
LNQYLTMLLNTIGIDIEHLKSKYLSATELEYLDSLLASEQDFEQDFYTSDYGDRLECLLFFLNAHKKDIMVLMQGRGKVEKLFELYTSSTISGNYDCFRFDLSKFLQTYTSSNQVLTLYRIGRGGECEGNLGCSWATSIDGLRAYCDSSAISKSILESKPIFVITIDDSQVLFEGIKRESEFVLKPDFTHKTLAMLDVELRNQISR